MKDLIKAFNGTVDGAGILVGISDTTNILNIILLVLSILGIIMTLFFSVYDHIKNKNIAGIEKDFDHATERLEDLKDKLQDKDE